MAGLLAIMWGSGIVAGVRRRIAAPMVSGMISSTVLTLGVIPAPYAPVKDWPLTRGSPLLNQLGMQTQKGPCGTAQGVKPPATSSK